MADRPLRSLEEANAEAAQRQAAWRQPEPSGISCPECGTELVDRWDKRFDYEGGGSWFVKTECPGCAYRGRRLGPT